MLQSKLQREVVPFHMYWAEWSSTGRRLVVFGRMWTVGALCLLHMWPIYCRKCQHGSMRASWWLHAWGMVSPVMSLPSARSAAWYVEKRYGAKWRLLWRTIISYRISYLCRRLVLLRRMLEKVHQWRPPRSSARVFKSFNLDGLESHGSLGCHSWRWWSCHDGALGFWPDPVLQFGSFQVCQTGT